MTTREPTDEELKAMPDHFYKYRDFSNPERLKSAILEHKFFFDSPNNFNDPFECLPSFRFDATEAEIVRYYMRLMKRRHPTVADEQLAVRALEYRMTAKRDHQIGSTEFRTHHINTFRDVVLPQLPMFCLAATNTNVLLWSHYAWNHTGVCLQFDANSPDIASAHRVIYGDKRPEVNLIVIEPTELVMEKTVLSKAKDWAYEEEWRVILLRQKAGARTFKPETLTGIIFGHKTAPEHKSMVKEWLEAREFPVRLMQAQISMDTYEVDIHEA